MEQKKLFSLKAFSVLTGLLFFVCLTTGSAGASHVTSMDFSSESDWVQENASSGTDFAGEKVALSGYDAWYDPYGPSGTGDVVQVGNIYVARNTDTAGTAVNGSKPWQDAMTWAAGLNWLNQTDWRLPSRGELLSIFDNRDSVGSYTIAAYWTSQWIDSERAYCRVFRTSSSQEFNSPRTEYNKVRAVRTANPEVIYPTTDAYYIYSNTSQIDTSLWDSIESVTTTETTPANTSIKYLVSFDNRNTWKYWTGSAWANSSLDDFQTNGMNKTALEAINGSQWSSTGGFTEGTVDFAIDLNTTDSDSTPELSGISFNYLRDTYDRIDAGIGSLELGYSEAQKEELYWLYKHGKADLDPENITIDGTEWQYYPGDLPGQDGHSIGDSYIYDGKYYIYLGSGVGEPGGVPELPAGAMPFLGTILSVALRRLKRRLLKTKERGRFPLL